MPHRYRQPGDENTFEEFCLVLLREHWTRPGLDRYGKRGERQHGVDLIDTGGVPPLRGVQCKHHDIAKTLPPKEVADEVEKAKTFPESLAEFYILTTAKKSTQAQNTVIRINKEHAARGLFVVRLLTWDDIERIVDDCPAGQDSLGVQSPQVVRKMLRAELRPLQDSVRANNGDAHGSKLDEAKKHLEEGRPELATLLLGQLRATSWDQLSPRNRFRWCTLSAGVEMRQGAEIKAAQLLLEAKTYQPEDNTALSNEIAAYESLGDSARAFEIASEYLASRPYAPAIYAGAIRTAPSYADFMRLFESRPPQFKDDPEVWLAAAMRTDLPDLKAEAIARRATELASDDPRGWLALAGSLLPAYGARVDVDLAPAPNSPARGRVERARGSLSKVIELSRTRHDRRLEVVALIRRATSSSMLGDTSAAYADIEEAYRLAPDDDQTLFARARMEDEKGHHDDAVRLLRQLAMRRPDDDVRFFLGISLWNRNGSGDREEAVPLLKQVGTGKSAQATLAQELVIEGLVLRRCYEEAREYLRTAPSALGRSLVATLACRIEYAAGNLEAASTHATGALAELTPETDRSTVRKLAKLLVSLGRLADSFSLWERVLSEGVVTDDTRTLVEIAGRLGRDKYVLDMCARIRQAGAFDDFLVQSELRLLDKYDPETALTLVQELVHRDPSDRRAHLHLVHLAIRLEKTALAESHLGTLPPVESASAEEGAAAVQALSKLGHAKEAVAYAYDLLRRHFSHHHAHRAFRNAVMFREDEGPLDRPEQAGPGVAVRLSEKGVENSLWFVLEDSQIEASGVENEIRPDSPLGIRVTGKKVGDEVVLSDGPGLRRTAVVSEILPKVVFRIRDVWDRWQYRFPEHQELWVGRLTKDGDDAEPDFSDLYAVLGENQRRAQAAEEVYANKVITVRILGALLGQSDIHTMGYLSARETLPVRCCVGSGEEYSTALDALKACSEIVLDLTGFATLMMLDQTSILQKMGKTILVTHSSMAEIRTFLDDQSGRDSPAGSLGTTEDGPRMLVQSAEVRQQRREKALALMALFGSSVKVISGIAIAGLDPGDREELERAMGTSGLESAVAGAGSSRILWTDDGVLALIARDKFGTKRIWTQGVLRWLNQEGILSDSSYAEAGTWLLGSGYEFTSVNPQIMRTAANHAEWQPPRPPLKQALAYLAMDSVRTEDAATLSARLIAHCYLDVVIPETRRELIIASAEALAKRSDARRALSLCKRLLPRAFGLNVVSGQDAATTFDLWWQQWLRRVH